MTGTMQTNRIVLDLASNAKYIKFIYWFTTQFLYASYDMQTHANANDKNNEHEYGYATFLVHQNI